MSEPEPEPLVAQAVHEVAVDVGIAVLDAQPARGLAGETDHAPHAVTDLGLPQVLPIARAGPLRLVRDGAAVVLLAVRVALERLVLHPSVDRVRAVLDLRDDRPLIDD